MYKIITSSKDSKDLSIGFDRSRIRRKDELALNKNVKSKYHLKMMLKDVFGLAEHQDKATYGLGYKLTIKRNKAETVIDKAGVLLVKDIKLVTFIGTYLIIILPFNNKVFCLNKF